MNQRVERVSAQIRALLGEALIKGEIRDPRVQQAGLITFTHLRLSADLREARALFMVHDADPETLERVRQGLSSASGYLRRLIGQQLRLKVTPSLSFEIDRVFEEGEKIDALLRGLGGEEPKR
jgi:ribosome-binding factor A